MLSRITFAVLAIGCLLALMGWAQDDDEVKQLEAEAYARGYAAGRSMLLPTVGDAYRLGMVEGRSRCDRADVLAQGARP